MACPVSATSPFSLHGHVDRLAEYAMTGPAEAPATDPDLYTDMFQDDDGNTITQVRLPYGAPTEFQVDDLALRTEPLQISADVVSEGQSSLDWEAVLAYGLLGTWLVGTLGLLIRATVQYLRFAIRLHSSPETTDQATIDKVLRACDATGCRRRPTLKEVDDLTVPAVFGVLRHTVCLPAGTVNELSPEEFRWVLKHEIAHITRRDSLLLSIALLVRACHWFNLLAWLAVSRLRNHMEQAADDTAMRSESPQSLIDYGRLLLTYSAGPAGARQSATMGLLFVSGKKRLQQRIEVLDLNKRRNHWIAKSTAIALLVLVAMTGLTDAATPNIEPQPHIPLWHQIDAPLENVSFGSVSPPGLQEADSPKTEATYDVKGALRKLTETLPEPSMDAETYVTSFFKYRPANVADDFSLADGKLTVTQTAEAHRNTKSMLHAWERSGAWQVSLECRVIVADLNIARDFDWDLSGIVTASDGKQQDVEISRIPDLDAAADFPLSAASSSQTAVGLQTQDRSLCVRPIAGMKISEFQCRLLMNRAQRDPRTNILLAPKVTLFNGQRAWIADEAQRPFVTGVRPLSDDNEELQPVI
jgi:beta-lactamase regulating signal transducer with metallopeptidase domain